MATKISEKPDATTPLSGTEQIVCVQSGATKKCTVADLRTGLMSTSWALTAGTGLTGGGDGSANRSLAVDYGSAPGAIATTGSAGAATTASRSDHTHQAEDVTARTAASTLTGAEVLGLSQSAALRKTGLAAILGMALIFQLFGSGADGDVTVTGTVNLSRDMYYRNLTISGSGNIRTNGFRVFVSDTLDLTAAPSDALQSRSAASNGGNGATAGTGGTGGSAVTGISTGHGFAGSVGGAGGTAAGVQAAVTTPGQAGGTSGAGGAGGSGSGGAGGVSRAGAAGLGMIPGLLDPLQVYSSSAMLSGGSGAPGGSGGGGDGTSGSGGGGGGSGGAPLILFARRILRGAGTAAGAISAKGGNGGNGGSATAGDRGGGGGGAGAGGGYLLLCYAELLGSTATNALDASGGNGATGGNGAGTGGGGNGGSGGSSGRLVTWDLSTWTVTDTPGSAGAAGSAASGTTGGNGGAGHSLRANL